MIELEQILIFNNGCFKTMASIIPTKNDQIIFGAQQILDISIIILY